MKKVKGFSMGAIVAVILIVAGLVVATVLLVQRNNDSSVAVDFSSYMGTSIIEASEENGQIGDHVLGNPEAPVVIHEYANFQCAHCAADDPFVRQAVEESEGKLAIVFRSMTWSAMQNSKAAAAAAEAAGLQGHWEEYAGMLFENQAEWGYAEGEERTALFEKYFKEVAGEDGDIEKYRADVAGEAVAKKVAFDGGLADELGVEGTPAFYIDGQHISTTGEEMTIDGKTVQLKAVETGDDLVKLLKDIVAAKTGA